CLEGHQGEADAHRSLKESKQALCLQSTVLVVDMVHPQHVAVGHACPFFLQLAVLLSHNMQKTPPSCTEESPELFDHSVGYMLQADAQRFEGSNDGTQVEEGSNVSLERGGAQEGQESGSHVPPAAAYCQVCSSDKEGGDDEVTDLTWVPNGREEEEAHLQRGRMPSRGQLKGSHPIASHRRAKV
ncbi:hypothetical protein AB205_0186860, partial [Aquarana catesbeiana]